MLSSVKVVDSEDNAMASTPYYMKNNTPPGILAMTAWAKPKFPEYWEPGICSNFVVVFSRAVRRFFST
jgi:hypothetical protein